MLDLKKLKALELPKKEITVEILGDEQKLEVQALDDETAIKIAAIAGSEGIGEDEKELRAMGQLVSGYLDFAERQAEREQAMTMQDWAEHLDRILTMGGEQLLIGNGSVSREQAVDKATEEYRKYKARTFSAVEQDYFASLKLLEQKTNKK